MHLHATSYSSFDCDRTLSGPLIIDENFIAPFSVSQPSFLEAQAQTFLLESKIIDASRSFEIFQGECALINTGIAKPMIIGTTEVPL